MVFNNKYHLLWFTIINIYVSLKQVHSDEINLQWGKDCPRACNCKSTDFVDLPIVKLMNNGIKSKLEPHDSKTQNEVIEDEDEEKLTAEKNNMQMLKTAYCVFMNVTKSKDFLNFLPTDTEALILFQTTDSEDITIEDDIKLPKLILFEIHGNDPTKIYITDIMIKSLKNIKYINIQNVSLDKLTLESNEPAQTIDENIYRKENSYAFNELIPVLPTYLHKENNIKRKKLIFVQPKDVEMVPFEVYKKTKRAKSNNLFSNNKNLSFLRITNCGLKYVSSDLFKGLDSLETLILDNNAIEHIPDFSFYGANMLKSLSLANNKIKYLQVTGLGGLLDLKYLNLKNNALAILSETTFPPLPKLIVADLSNNPIEAVYPHTFEVLNSTTELTLGSNDTELHLHQNSFIGLDSLEVLNLININVLILERNVLIGLPKLIALDIKGTIKHIAFDAFVEVSNMKRLILSNCSIQSVSMDSFYGVYNLEHLDLSNNQLKELPPGLFDQQFSLKELIMSNNQLSSLPDGLFKGIPNVKLIRLDMNPLYCSCHMKSWDISLMTKSVSEKKHFSCEWDHLKKGYNCPMKNRATYTYNKKVEPTCSGPSKFKGKTVSYVMRKYLNCNSDAYSTKTDLYIKKKYKEFKNLKLRSEVEVQQSTPTNDMTSNSPLLKTNSYNIISNYTSNISNGTVSNVTTEMVNKTLEPVSTERSVLLNNGTYISKSSLKEEISKMARKNKEKSIAFQLQQKQ